MERHKTCSFFGHRKVEPSEELQQKLKEVVEDLIVNRHVLTFLFGSRSDFDSLCHIVVTRLKEKYPQIKRIAYTCKSEACILEKEKIKWEKIYSRFQKREVCLFGFEEEYEHKTKYTAGRASYVERNQAMINDSDYCIFYYDKNYQPNQGKYTKRNSYCSAKSGTALAYVYAQKKKKFLINVYNTTLFVEKNKYTQI